MFAQLLGEPCTDALAETAPGAHASVGCGLSSRWSSRLGSSPRAATCSTRWKRIPGGIRAPSRSLGFSSRAECSSRRRTSSVCRSSGALRFRSHATSFPGTACARAIESFAYPGRGSPRARPSRSGGPIAASEPLSSSTRTEAGSSGTSRSARGSSRAETERTAPERQRLPQTPCRFSRLAPLQRRPPLGSEAFEAAQVELLAVEPQLVATGAGLFCRRRLRAAPARVRCAEQRCAPGAPSQRFAADSRPRGRESAGRGGSFRSHVGRAAPGVPAADPHRAQPCGPRLAPRKGPGSRIPRVGWLHAQQVLTKPRTGT
jgi:hypothetical protein